MASTPPGSPGGPSDPSSPPGARDSGSEDRSGRGDAGDPRRGAGEGDPPSATAAPDVRQAGPVVTPGDSMTPMALAAGDDAPAPAGPPTELAAPPTAREAVLRGMVEDYSAPVLLARAAPPIAGWLPSAWQIILFVLLAAAIVRAADWLDG